MFQETILVPAINSVMSIALREEVDASARAIEVIAKKYLYIDPVLSEEDVYKALVHLAENRGKMFTVSNYLVRNIYGHFQHTDVYDQIGLSVTEFMMAIHAICKQFGKNLTFLRMKYEG